MQSLNSITNPQSKTCLIIVMGVSGSGKTTLAQALADHYHYAFLDADDFHSAEARALMAEGVPLTEEHRAPWAERIKATLEANNLSGKHCCLAFSGLKQKHRDMLREAGLRTLFIHLRGGKDTIQDRINNRKGHFMAPALLTSQFEALEETTNEKDVFDISVTETIEQITKSSIQLIDHELYNSSDR